MRYVNHHIKTFMLSCNSQPMNSYLIIAKFPKNPRQYIKNLKTYLLESCAEQKMDCVVERLNGRLIVFSSSDPCKFAAEFKNVLRCVSVKIFDDKAELVNLLTPPVKNANSFAVRANHLSIAQEIGEQLYEATHTPVNLENPELLIEIEFRENKYLLLNF